MNAVKVVNMFADMLVCDRSPVIPVSFERLTSTGFGGRYPPLRADAVDVLEKSARLDRFAYIPTDVREIIYVPD